MAGTLAEKVWEAHLVHKGENGEPDLLHEPGNRDSGAAVRYVGVGPAARRRASVGYAGICEVRSSVQGSPADARVRGLLSRAARALSAATIRGACCHGWMRAAGIRGPGPARPRCAAGWSPRSANPRCRRGSEPSWVPGKSPRRPCRGPHGCSIRWRRAVPSAVRTCPTRTEMVAGAGEARA